MKGIDLAKHVNKTLQQIIRVDEYAKGINQVSEDLDTILEDPNNAWKEKEIRELGKELLSELRFDAAVESLIKELP